jgi:hypothetical protein
MKRAETENNIRKDFCETGFLVCKLGGTVLNSSPIADVISVVELSGSAT